MMTMPTNRILKCKSSYSMSLLTKKSHLLSDHPPRARKDPLTKETLQL